VLYIVLILEKLFLKSF